jgi:hypothetical protein
MTGMCVSTTRNLAWEFCSWEKFRKKQGLSSEVGLGFDPSRDFVGRDFGSNLPFPHFYLAKKEEISLFSTRDDCCRPTRPMDQIHSQALGL